jgi:hypothetical protein
MEVGDSIIKRGRGDPINLFNPATFLWLSKASTWISNVIGRVLYLVSFVHDFDFNISNSVCINFSHDSNIKSFVEVAILVF